MERNIFEYAVKHKLRFPFKGQISTEDLYDLTPAALDGIYKTLCREAKKNEEESLLATKSTADVELTVKIDIVKYIVAQKLKTAEAAKKAAATKAQAEKIRGILARKQDAALEGMSEEELQRLLDDLDGDTTAE